MKKLGRIALIAMIFLSACSSSADEGKSEVSSGVVKMDAKQNYVYAVAEDKDGVDYFHYVDTLTDNGETIEEYRSRYFADRTNSVEGFDLFYAEGVFLPVERIVLNFESEDAVALQKELDELYNDVMDKNTASFATTDSPYTWNTLSLLNSYEDDTVISFTIHTMETQYKSEYHSVVANSYVFNKSTGHLMSDAEIVAHLGITQEELESQSYGEYALVFMYYDEVTAEVSYADESYRFVPTGDTEDGIHYFKIQESHALSITGASSYGVILNTTSDYLDVGNPERTVGLDIERSKE